MFRHHICPRCRRQYLAEAPVCPHCGTTRAQRFAARLRDINQRLTTPIGGPRRPRRRIHPAGATDTERPRLTAAEPGPITACRHCQQPVSRGAKTCPHCGVDAPAQNRWERAVTELFKPGTLVGIAVLYLLIKWSLPDAPPSPAQRTEAANQEAACRASASCWSGRHAGSTYDCRRAIEAQAKHAVRWPEGWLAPDFPGVFWDDQAAGTLKLFGGADLQNGFGAWTPYIVGCLYDTRTDRVLRVELRPGRL